MGAGNSVARPAIRTFTYEEVERYRAKGAPHIADNPTLSRQERSLTAVLTGFALNSNSIPSLGLLIPDVKGFLGNPNVVSTFLLNETANRLLVELSSKRLMGRLYYSPENGISSTIKLYNMRLLHNPLSRPNSMILPFAEALRKLAYP